MLGEISIGTTSMNREIAAIALYGQIYAKYECHSLLTKGPCSKRCAVSGCGCVAPAGVRIWACLARRSVAEWKGPTRGADDDALMLAPSAPMGGPLDPRRRLGFLFFPRCQSAGRHGLPGLAMMARPQAAGRRHGSRRGTPPVAGPAPPPPEADGRRRRPVGGGHGGAPSRGPAGRRRLAVGDGTG